MDERAVLASLRREGPVIIIMGPIIMGGGSMWGRLMLIWVLGRLINGGQLYKLYKFRVDRCCGDDIVKAEASQRRGRQSVTQK